MQQSVQTDATCNFQQCSELLSKNFTSVCTGLYVKPVAVSYFQIQNGVYCKFTISWNLNWVAGAKSGGKRGKNPSSFFPPLVPIPTPATQAEALWKRTQHSWPSSPNIVGCYMLCPFAHPVACCSVLLGVVVQSLKPVKLLATRKRTQQLATLQVQQLRPFARSLVALREMNPGFSAYLVC